MAHYLSKMTMLLHRHNTSGQCNYTSVSLLLDRSNASADTLEYQEKFIDNNFQKVQSTILVVHHIKTP